MEEGGRRRGGLGEINEVHLPHFEIETHAMIIGQFGLPACLPESGSKYKNGKSRDASAISHSFGSFEDKIDAPARARALSP